MSYKPFGFWPEPIEIMVAAHIITRYTLTMKYSGDDFYCDVALKGIVPLRKEYESDKVLAYHHTSPHWPVHIVVVPKRHISSFTSLDLDTKDTPVLLELFDVIKQLASKIEDEHGAARILTNLGKYQDSKHLHFHISSGKKLRED